MSRETGQWLNDNVVTWERAWHQAADSSNIYPGGVPMEVVRELLTSWTPEEIELYDADMKHIEEFKAIRRSDTQEIFAVHGDGYQTHTYKDWLTDTVTDSIASDEDVIISSAGLLKKGAQAWVVVQRPMVAHAHGGVEFWPFLTLSTSLDGSMSTQINKNNQVAVCDNTLEIERNINTQFLFRHTKGSGSRLAEFRGVAAALAEGETDFAKEVNRLLETSVDPTQFQKFLETQVPIKDDDGPAKKTRSERKRQEITQLYKADERAASWTGTAYGVLQAFNTWDQHLSRLVNRTGKELDDRNLRAMRNYSRMIQPPKRGGSADELLVRSLEAQLA